MAYVTVAGSKRKLCRVLRRRAAFTAIELIGVLAVVAILAAALVPNVIRRIDRATWQRVTSDLSTMANGLVQCVKRDKQIPASNAIAQAIAKYSDLATSQITNTPRGFRRLFLVDPAVSINGSGLSSTYLQGNGGSSSRPANTRVMILSTIAQPAVSVISDSFANIWNTPPGGKPASWTGKTDDLCIQRVELGGLFHKLELLNIDTNNLGYYGLETNTASFVAPNTSIVAYVLDGTSVNLYEFGGTTLEVRLLLTQDESFVYQNDRWARGLAQTQFTQTLGVFGLAVRDFLNAPARPGSKFSATQQSVSDEMYTYLSSYALWASGNPAQGITNFQGSGQNQAPQFPYFMVLQNSQTRLANLSNNLVH